MHEYIFRVPADIPDMTFEGTQDVSDVGTTVTLDHYRAFTLVYLYSTHIATLTPGAVNFTVHGHSSQATRFWLERLIRDNGAGSSVWRVARQRKGQRVSYYAVDGKKDMPVEGGTFRGDGGASCLSPSDVADSGLKRYSRRY